MEYFLEYFSSLILLGSNNVSDINQLAEEAKLRLLKSERKTASTLVRAYGLAYQRIQTRIAALTAQIDDARVTGEISSSFLYERDRLRNLQIEIEREMRRFASLATERVTSEQGLAVETAATDARVQLSASLEQGAASRGLSFNALNSEAVSALAGFAGDGQPLRLLFDKIAPQMAGAISDELVAGVAENAPARVIAERIREKSGIGLARALLISRTEVLRSYRTATLENYKASGVVTRWRWLSAQDTRTCIICILMDGKEFPLSVPFASHVGCRCQMLSVLENTPPAKTGLERFSSAEAGVQKELLGKSKFDAWKNGDLKLEDLIGIKMSSQWGTVRYERSLREVTASSDFRKRVRTGGRRNELPLTIGEMQEATSYAVLLGMPVDAIRFTESMNTSYGRMFGKEILYIGTDVLPDPEAAAVNSMISMRGALAHEIVGHRQAELAGRGIDEAYLDEAQASLRAARLAPGLTEMERRVLESDARERLLQAGKSLAEVSLWLEKFRE